MNVAMNGATRRPYLEVEHVSKRFGAFEALKDVSLTIHQGELVCFLGPSGCGKTTLLRAIAGLDIQSSGTIRQAGRDISALAPSQRDFGIVFQSYALFPNLTVEQNVGYGLKGQQRSKVAARVAELLALVGLPEQGRKYPAQLSGGQQQRVALARAIATSPGLLLLDEPLSALDARVRVHLRAEIVGLQRRLGITTIMVTHDQEEALTMADRIVVMSQGRIEQVGTPLEVYRRPASAFVADFIGRMNFMPATVAPDGTVRVGDVSLACDHGTDGLAPGSQALLCIRPEDVVVRGVEPGTGNVVITRIVDMEFLGSFFRARLAPEVSAAELSADFSVNAVRDLGLAAGGNVAVALPRDRLSVYPKP
ncbi:MAG: putative 2-aminoethylphosphonate ABC transporter ATP-binding protein [Dongiaceae bacterium]